MLPLSQAMAAQGQYEESKMKEVHDTSQEGAYRNTETAEEEKLGHDIIPGGWAPLDFYDPANRTWIIKDH